MESPKPILSHPFEKHRVVICGYCKGNKVVNDGQTCNACHGSGMLHEVRKGTVELYSTN